MGCWGIRLLRTIVGSPGYRDAIYGEDPYDLTVISCLAEPPLNATSINERALSGRHITDDRAHCSFCFMSRLDVDRNH